MRFFETGYKLEATAVYLKSFENMADRVTIIRACFAVIAFYAFTLEAHALLPQNSHYSKPRNPVTARQQPSSF